MTEALIRALAGGALIGMASLLLFASLGRIAGIAGIASHTVAPAHNESLVERRWRWWFLLGLMGAGAVVVPLSSSAAQPWPAWPVLIAGAVSVGVGTVLGAGCTSGHGVCGLGRLSLRSLVAVGVFMSTGMLVASTFAP